MSTRVTLNNAYSLLVSILRGGRGLRVQGGLDGARRPAQPLIVYELEACPYCRKVREALSELDLEAIVYPCARGSRHRDAVVQAGGKGQFPFLVDPNTGRSLYESEDIVTYLAETYGHGRAALGRALSPLNTASSAVASGARPRGLRVLEEVQGRPAPAEPLVLWNFEASPYCRKVREALNELDLPYHVKNVAKKSPRRPQLVALGGKMRVPYLQDPNTGAAMYESEDIVAYLHRTYGPGAQVPEAPPRAAAQGR